VTAWASLGRSNHPTAIGAANQIADCGHDPEVRRDRGKVIAAFDRAHPRNRHFFAWQRSSGTLDSGIYTMEIKEREKDNERKESKERGLKMTQEMPNLVVRQRGWGYFLRLWRRLPNSKNLGVGVGATVMAGALRYLTGLEQRRGPSLPPNVYQIHSSGLGLIITAPRSA
jgi:hypothetical protein